jgi:GNAT superfamily N-acetyltransferase
MIGDINYLFDIDLKCFDDPLESDDWKVILTSPDRRKLISVVSGEPIGFVVWFPTKASCTIVRLAVKPAYRNQGIGRQLLQAVCRDAKQQSIPIVTLAVSESLCCPGEPRDASQWLLNRSFKTNGHSGVMRNWSVCFGQREDAFLFVLDPENLK